MAVKKKKPVRGKSASGEKKRPAKRIKTSIASKISHKKTATPIHPIKTDVPAPARKREKYLYSVGRRKSSVARVRYYPGKEYGIQINGKDISDMFLTQRIKAVIEKPLAITSEPKGQITIRVTGGGSCGQADSIQLGISRILLKIDANHRPVLKQAGLLTRDSRVKERKKYGLRGARRAPQWQKR